METTSFFGSWTTRVVERLDALSSTQLYALIVGWTVVISFVLLGKAPTYDHANLAAVVEQPATTTTTTRSNDGLPEPKWHIFRYVNYLIVAAFCLSVMDFLSRYYGEEKDSGVLIQFLAVWSVFLCYFFAFFGVSFVYDDLGTGEEEEETRTTTKEPKSAASCSDPLKKPLKHAATSCSAPPKNDVASTLCGSNLAASLKKAPPTCGESKPPPPPAHSLVDCTNEDVVEMVLNGQVKDHQLEKRLSDCTRAVEVRRAVALRKLGKAAAVSDNPLAGLPVGNNNTLPLDYSRVHGANCESVIGFVPIPVGLVGPLTVNGEQVYVPMATTEGCLVASTNRGCKAIFLGSGCTAEVTADGITRAPCLRCDSAQQAVQVKRWCETPDNFAKMKQAFESTTSFGKLISCQPTIAGRNLYLRLVCFAGDAMGMNMVSKGSLAVIELLQEVFADSVQLVALSGNMCTDKKAAATNWIHGRGKSVVVEATIPKQVVKSVLKTTVQAMAHVNLQKNLIGSAMAASVGGFNAHASNIVTAIFLATGQDPAQVVESSNCITLIEETPEGDLWMSCTMPSLEVGTVGGGTGLAAQAACLKVLDCQGASRGQPGDHAVQLAKIIASATLAGELSLLAALAANTLVQAHMQHNRK